MEPIKQNESVRDREERSRSLGEFIEQTTAKKKRIVRGRYELLGTAVGTFIIFVAIVRLHDRYYGHDRARLDGARLGFLRVHVLRVCDVHHGSGNGIRRGTEKRTYLSAKKLYDDLKDEIIEKKMQGRLPEFCRYYVEEELRNTRNSILTEVGIDFSVYQEVCRKGKGGVGADYDPFKIAGGGDCLRE